MFPYCTNTRSRDEAATLFQRIEALNPDGEDIFLLFNDANGTAMEATCDMEKPGPEGTASYSITDETGEWLVVKAEDNPEEEKPPVKLPDGFT